MSKKNNGFQIAYLIFFATLVILSAISIIYTSNVIKSYDENRPENVIQNEIDKAVLSAKNGNFSKEYHLPEITKAKYEENIDVAKYYETQFASGDLTFDSKLGTVEDNSLIYQIKDRNNVLAEIKLDRVGEEKTKLFILKISNWKVDYFNIILEPKDYKVYAPKDINVNINGIDLTDEDIDTEYNGDGKSYKLDNLYFIPSVIMTGDKGENYECKIKAQTIKAVIYDYELSLPKSLSVIVNGNVDEGVALHDGITRHNLRFKEEPDIEITDLYGNKVKYDTGIKLPITYLYLSSPDNFDIEIDGNKASEYCISECENTQLENIKKFDDAVYGYNNYSLAVLKDGAEIVIKDSFGNVVDYDKSLSKLDLTDVICSNTVPDSIANEVNVLEVAENWSLFMTSDLPGEYRGLKNICQYLAEGSPVYESAVGWANGIDVTFTSVHSLGNPKFTEEKVNNYTPLSNNSFYVDISFTKEMYVAGKRTPDRMDNRFFFAKINGAWKLVDMK